MPAFFSTVFFRFLSSSHYQSSLFFFFFFKNKSCFSKVFLSITIIFVFRVLKLWRNRLREKWQPTLEWWTVRILLEEMSYWLGSTTGFSFISLALKRSHLVPFLLSGKNTNSSFLFFFSFSFYKKTLSFAYRHYCCCCCCLNLMGCFLFAYKWIFL